MQERGEELGPVRFGGRSLTKAESRYCASAQELLAVYFAVKCEYFLIGIKFICYTDHKPLVHLKVFKSIVNKRYRWIQYFESINTLILNILGQENVVSDYISRNVIKEEEKFAVIVDDMDLFEVDNYTIEETKMKQKSDSSLEVVKCLLQGIKLP